MSLLRATSIRGRTDGSAPTFPDGASVTGVITATTFSGGVVAGVATATTFKGNVESTTGTITNVVATDIQVSGATTITGNLTVKGTQSIINSQSLEVRDKTIGIGSTSSPSNTTADGAGIQVYGGGGGDKTLTWGNTGTKWTLTGGALQTAEVNVTGVGTITNLVSTDTNTSGVTTSGTFVGRHGNVTNNAKSSAYVLVLSDAGKMINTDSNVTVPENIFSAGDVITVVNKSTSNISVVKGTGINLYKVGTATNATVTLAQKGVAVITCFSGNDFIVGGGGVS